MRVKEALGVGDVGCSGGEAPGKFSMINAFPRTNHRLQLSVKHCTVMEFTLNSFLIKQSNPRPQR